MASLSNLPEDILREIASFLPTISLVRLLSSSKKLWNLRDRLQIGNEPFVDITHKYSKYVKDTFWIEALELAISKNCKESALYFIKRGGAKMNCNIGMAMAAKSGNVDMIQFFISNGAEDWESGMKCAATGGHFKIVEFFWYKGAINTDECMEEASAAGSIEIVQFMRINVDDISDDAIRKATRSGNQQLVEYLKRVQKRKRSFASSSGIPEERKRQAMLEIQKNKRLQHSSENILDFLSATNKGPALSMEGLRFLDEPRYTIYNANQVEQE